MSTKKTPEERRAAKAKKEEERRKHAEDLAESKQRKLEEFNATIPARLNAALTSAHGLGFDPEVTLDDNGPVVTFDFMDACGATVIRTVRDCIAFAPGLIDYVESQIKSLQDERALQSAREARFDEIKKRLTPEERGIIREFYNRL